jgi:lipoprotein-releasing system ATP-binding protein
MSTGGREPGGAAGSGLELDDVRKSFGSGRTEVEVLSGVSLAVGPGESVVVTGPSGSGKSTLLHLVGALDTPSSGSIRLDGRDLSRLDEDGLARFRNREVGFVFQHHHLLPQYTVLENVLLPCFAFADAPRDEAWARQLLDRVGLHRRLAHRPSELSGGERQRTALARALVLRPRMLLCDEPTGSLDRSSADRVADLLFELHDAEQSILLTVTHSPDLAGRFPRCCELVEGRCSEV